MRNHLFVLLIVLIFSISPNQGEKLKANYRRASGLMAYPRVGRSDQPIDFNRHRENEADMDTQFYNVRESDFDPATEKDYEDPRSIMSVLVGKSINLKHSDNIPMESSWLITKDQPLQKIDEGRSRYLNSLLLARDPKTSQTNGYAPGLGHESYANRVFCK